MADVTISQLSTGTPNKNSAVIPYSDGSTTYKTSPSGIVAASPGSVLQVVQSVKTDRQLISGPTYVDIDGLSLSITPKSSLNKIMIQSTIYGGCDYYMGYLRLNRNGTDICMPSNVGNRTNNACSATISSYIGSISESSYIMQCANINFLDTPNTISPIVYKIRGCAYSTNQFFRINASYISRDQAEYDPVVVSTITATEIAG